MNDLPVINVTNGGSVFYADGEPFVALGVQWDFRNTIAPARSEYLYEHAAAMNCTTAFVPVLWSQVEPERGCFTFAFVDRQITLAARNGLKLSLLWFGSNRGGSMRFKNKYYPDEDAAEFTYQVPGYIAANPGIYRRACLPDGRAQESLCPTCLATLIAEKTAFCNLLRHLAEMDQARTVILMQVENEISTPEITDLAFPPRCYCSGCNERFAESGLTQRQFGDRTYGDYVAELIEAGAEVYSLPFYVNFVGVPRPGEDIQYYLDKAPHLIACAPDIYAGNSSEFRRNQASFAVGRNVPLVAETSSDTKDPSERNLYYAVSEGGAIGYDLWAIDTAYGLGAWEPGYGHRTPLVDREGHWSPKAYQIKEEYGIMRRVMVPLSLSRGTEWMQWFVAEGEACKTPLELPGLRGQLDIAANGRGFAIQTGLRDLTLAGHDFVLNLEGLTGEVTALAGGWSGYHFVPDGGHVQAEHHDGVVSIFMPRPAVVRLRWGLACESQGVTEE